MNAEKLQKLQAAVRIGGKGTPRRKHKVVHSSTSAAQDDKKLNAAIKKLNVQPINGVEECNMFKNDGMVLHFKQPNVKASIGSNMFVLSGMPQEKPLAEMMPAVMSQLGHETLNQLRHAATQFQQNGGVMPALDAAIDDDDIPELTENFEELQADA